MSKQFSFSVDIDPEAKNPLYDEAMRLSDAQPGTQFIAFDDRRGDLAVVTLKSAWQISEVNLVRAFDINYPSEYKIGSYLSVVANKEDDLPVHLPRLGVYHFLADSMAWHEHRFAVVVKPEPIVRFHSWLGQMGYPRTANQVKDTFSGFFLDDTFWNGLIEHTRP